LQGDLVFTVGATGILNCLNLVTGAVKWRRDLLADNAASLPEWGMAGSPLIVDELVVVSAGGAQGHSLVAYQQQTGARVWHHGSAPTHWSSPVLADLAGQRQILMFNAEEVTAHAARGGAVLWSYPWRGGHPHVCMPLVVDGDRVLISSGYGTGSQLVRVTRSPADGTFSTAMVWRSLALKAKFTNVVVREGFVYGLDDGILACVDLLTGKRAWKRGRYGHGQVLLVGEVLLVMAETGDLILVRAAPGPVVDGDRELSRWPVFDAKTWNPPALAGRYLLVRNHREAVCLRLPVAGD
jgi:outer membrane protein assembly factor BamB